MSTWIDPAAPAPKSSIGTPSGYEDTADFLREMRERYDQGRTHNQHNEIAGKEDAAFTIGDQWDDTVKAKRIGLHKPVLTENRLIALVAQIVGNRLMNETEIRVHPDKGGTKEIAKIREGLIRSIYKNSCADLARDEALKYQVIGGQGAFCLAIDYVADDVFEQEIKLKHIADPFSITIDPASTEPTGGDAEWGFVDDDIPIKLYEKRYPGKSTTGFNATENESEWFTDETVRVTAYWRMVIEGTKTLALYEDGTTHDVSDKEEFEYLPFVALRKDGSPYVRQVPNRFARMYVCSGLDILEGPYDYPISSIPIYRVPGWEISDGKKLHRWGMVRPLKDPMRLNNYWVSTVAEQLVAVPRNKWLSTAAAIMGHEKRWRDAPTSDDPFLIYNDGETPPIHIPPPGIDGALVSEIGRTAQSLHDISNIHEASLGMQSNEVSGKAIQARQTVSDVGTFIYHDRLRLADERCARNINELIPVIYDTQRIVAVLGADNKTMLQTINDPADPNSDVTMGKYGVTVSVGPATVTKRALAAEQMMAFVNAIPETASQVMDLVADAQDWPKADEFAKRFRMSLPPGVVPQDELTPEMQQAQQQQQQMAQMQQQLAQKQAEVDIALKSAKAAEAEARAESARANAYKAVSDAQARMLDVESKVDDREVQATLKGLDQHNDIIAGDREFAHQVTQTRMEKEAGNDDGSE